MSKKLISMLTVMAMLMTMLSGAALAVAGEENLINNEDSLNAAIEAAGEGGTVTLEGNIELTKPVVINKEITLDMNGSKIYNKTGIWNTDAKDWSLISVQGGNLTITGEGTLDALENDCYAIDVRGGGTVTIENGTVIGNVSAVYVLEGTANIEGGEYSIKQLAPAPLNDARYTLNCLDENFRAGTAKINVTGGTFNKYNPAISNSENPEAVFVAEGYKAVADGENFIVEEDYEYTFRQAMAQGGNVTLEENLSLDSAIIVDKEVILDLNGKTISMTANDTSGDGVFWVKAGGDLTLGGVGTINGKSDGNNYDMAIWADGGKVTINGGTYTNVGAGADDHYDLIYAGSSRNTGGEIVINGGTFISHTTKWTLNTNDSNGTITVKGGNFFGYNPGDAYSEPTQPKSFLAEGYEVKADGNYYVVSPSAETAFRQAMAEGGNVTLTEDLCITAPIVVDKTVTLDMNGFKIYNEADIWNVADKEWSLISVRGGDLTITGNGTFAAKENDCYAVDVQAGTVTIEDGKFVGNVSAVYVLKGTANVEGGEYSIKQKSTFDDERYTLNCLDENFRAGTADINVTGGTFNKYNPAISNSENPEAVFVAEGYEAKQDGEKYVVSAIVIPEPPAPPVEDDDDDYTPAAPVVKDETTAKDENGKAIETEKQADGSVVVDAGEGDQFTVDTPKGEDATVVIETEGKNYGLVAVIVNEDGTETVITDTIPTENGIQFTVKDGQTVKIVDNSQIFDDVKEGDWNHDAVTFAAARGIVNGVGDGKFEPTAAATRGMVMTMLARLSGEDTTGGENWYAKGMEWARENGISDGTNPTAEISREQLIVMLWRLEGSPKANDVLNGFDDATDVSGWANDAMAWAVEKGLVQGNNGQLMPENNANRDQVAQILMNFILMK